LFFIESLWTGGTQRRLVELIGFIKQHTDFEIALVLTEDEIDFENVRESGITIKVIKRRGLKYDPLLYFKFCRFCNLFKPDIIHSWGVMTTFYSIPAKLLCKVPLVANMINDSKKGFKNYSLSNIFFKTNLLFSDVILSNSIAGLLAYQINSNKARVIYNGVDAERFHHNFNTIKFRERFGIKTKYIILMVASFSKYKDYDLFVDVAKEIGKTRDDTTFIGLGDGSEWIRIQKRIKDEKLYNIILPGKNKDVEPFIAASDIGLLCTYSEGISNSIIEYMSLGKPVISTDTIGGSKEIVIEGETGFCTPRNIESVISAINFLLNNEAVRQSFGNKGRERIRSQFSIERFGKEYERVYGEVLRKRREFEHR
jgi:glycosyltransferase involved in cell wall biosynthesis